MKTIRLLALGLAVVAALFIPAALHAQIYPTTYGLWTNGPATVATATTWSTGSSPIYVPQDRGLAVFAQVRGSAATTNGAVTYTFAVSQDGTNYSTDTTLQLALTPTGTNVLMGYKNFDRGLLNNIRYVRLASVQNAAAALVTNQIVGWSKGN